MAELTCTVCGAAMHAEDPLCRTCLRAPVAPPVVAAPAAPTRAEREAEVREAREELDSPLPTSLRGRYRVERAIDAVSTEADLYVVVAVDTEGGPADVERRVLKRYRQAQPPRPAPGVSDERRTAIVTDFEAGQVRARSELRAALELLSEVDDDHVIRIDAFDVDEGWELLEHVGGGTLGDLLAQRVAASEPFRDAEVLRIVDELALSLVAIHGAGLSHFDIKPENVLVRSRDPLDLVLTDFGSLAPMPTSTYMYDEGLQESAMYVAPERTGGTRTQKADVFAVGRIVERLLRTRLASGAEPDADVLEGIADPEARRRWELLLRGTLCREPEERWDAEELLAWARGEDVRRIVVRSAPTARGELLVVAGHTPTSAVEMARRIAADEDGWRSGREHLDRGRLRAWASAELPELARALMAGGEFVGIEDPDLRLLEVLLWIDPELPPAYSGWSLVPGAIPALLEATGASSGRGVARALAEHLACDARPVPAGESPAPAGDPVGVAVARLARGDSPAREPLRRLIADMATHRTELDAAAEALGLDGARTELCIQLLRRVARGYDGAWHRAPGPLAVLRRPRTTWSVLLGRSPAVRAVLVPMVVRATPLRDARRAIGRWLAHRRTVRAQRRMGRPSALVRALQVLALPFVFVAGFTVVIVEGFRSSDRVERAVSLFFSAVAVAVLTGSYYFLVNVANPLLLVRTPFDARIPAGAYEVDPEPFNFRGGPGRTNAAPDAVAPGRRGLEVDWVASIGNTRFDYADVLVSAPVVVGDLTIISSPGAVIVFDASSGERQWFVTNRRDGSANSGAAGGYLPVAATADTVYVASISALGPAMWLTAHDLSDGRVRWRMRIARGVAWSDVGSPVVADGRVLLSIPSRSSLVAVDARTGRRLWTHAEVDEDRKARLLSDPVVVDGRVYVAFAAPASRCARLVALDAATGAVLWRERPSTLDGSCGRLHDDVQIAADSGAIVAVADGAVRAYPHPARAPAHADGILLNPGWRHQLLDPERPEGALGIALSDHAVYVGASGTGRLTAYERSSGRLLWQAQLAASDARFDLIMMPLVAGDSVFVVVREAGSSFRIQELDARTGVRLRSASHRVLPWLASSEGRLFVMDDRQLTAYR